MKLLLTSHGKFCHGVKESYEMIAGENKDIYSLDLWGDPKKLDFIPETFRNICLWFFVLKISLKRNRS